MTFSGHTNVVRESSQRSSRNGAAIDHIILHHSAATDANQVVGMMVSGSRTVSSNYVIGRDGTVYGVVPEQYRAWTSGSSSDGGKGAAFDRRSITFEVADEKYGEPWPISEASYAAIAKVVADVSKRYGIPLDRDHVLGHRELWTRYRASYATACPGGMDVDRVVRDARKLLGQSVPTVGSGAVGTVTGRNYTSRPTADIQRLVGATPDGVYGPDTTRKVAAWQKAHGLSADGDWGPQSDAAGFGSKPAAPAAPATIAVDGVWGAATTRRLQQVLGVTADGILGPQTYRALQKRIGVTADGIWGPASKRGLQRHLGVAADGIIGPRTVKALQTRLNRGTV